MCSALLAISIWENQQDFVGERPSEEVIGENTDSVEYKLNKNIETVLVMGLDKFSEDVDSSS